MSTDSRRRPSIDQAEYRLLENIVREGWVIPSDLDIHDLKRVLYLIAIKYVAVEIAAHHQYPLIVPTKAGRSSVGEG